MVVYNTEHTKISKIGIKFKKTHWHNTPKKWFYMSQINKKKKYKHFIKKIKKKNQPVDIESNFYY